MEFTVYNCIVVTGCAAFVFAVFEVVQLFITRKNKKAMVVKELRKLRAPCKGMVTNAYEIPIMDTTRGFAMRKIPTQEYLYFYEITLDSVDVLEAAKEVIVKWEKTHGSTPSYARGRLDFIKKYAKYNASFPRDVSVAAADYESFEEPMEMIFSLDPLDEWFHPRMNNHKGKTRKE